MSKKIRIYRAHEIQKAAHESLARYRVLVWGRQSGKSTWGNSEGFKHVWKNRNKTYWYVLPTFSQAKVQFRRMERALHKRSDILRKISQTELFYELTSGSRLFYKSGEKPHNLRTETLDGVIIDEVRDQDPILWPQIISPMLRTTKGWCAFTGTPNGFDEFFELYDKAIHDKTGSWAAFQAKSTCNPKFSQEEFDDAMLNMSELEFKQEILAEFVELYAGKAYHNYSEANMSDVNPFTMADSWSPYLPIVVGMDFNLSPMAWALGQRNYIDWWWREEIFLQNSHTQEAAHELAQRVKDHKPGVILCGDATSKAGQRAAAGKSDYDILCGVLDSHGVRWRNETPESNPPIKDRLNAVNAKLKDATGQHHLWHHSRCKNLRRDFLRVTVKQGANFTLDPGAEFLLTHISDAIGYPTVQLSPVPTVFRPGKVSVITR